jgi:aryl hydrocarbon receptor nuclear translocator-like protein 1
MKIIQLFTPDALQSSDSVTTPIYGLRTKHNGFISVQSEWKSFRNPWTKEVEFLIAKNNVIFSDLDGFDEQDINENNFDFFNQCMYQLLYVVATSFEGFKIGNNDKSNLVYVFHSKWS